MYKFGNNNSNSNFRANGLARNVAHSRIEDEETIYKKYELGQKLGQVVKIGDKNGKKFDFFVLGKFRCCI